MVDHPVPFGWKIGWLAIKGSDNRAVMGALAVSDPKEVTWQEGLERAYDSSQQVFVTPSIDGWTLIVGGNWESDEDDEIPIWRYVAKLSERFGEVHAFATLRSCEYHYWVRAVGGKLVRAFVYDDGEILKQAGARTDVEKSLACFRRNSEDSSVCEDHVFTVAGAWSVDPTKLGAQTPAVGRGWLAPAVER